MGGGVEILANGRCDSSGQGECVSVYRTVMVVISNNTVFLWNCIAETSLMINYDQSLVLTRFVYVFYLLDP